ncbi:MAG: hypothetical protein HND56_01375 [Pseudomonadota bacterium]|nr:hypothetical protein [Pseudomonadota bacterium]QKK04414.1 MAG: hypothetical protein HND56_01375 [Pseudomonadota bacterium]
MSSISQLVSWCNDNSGFLSLLLFLAALAYGWLSGGARALVNLLINKDKESRIDLLERNLQLKERMKGDFLKDNYFQECYECDISEKLKRPVDKFIEKEILIRDIKDDTYPNLLDRKGISPFFKLAPKDFYHNGLSLFGYPQQAVVDELGNWTLRWKNVPKGFVSITVHPIYYIPFSRIVNYDMDRNEYDDGPIVFCKFEGLQGGPYEKIEYEPITKDSPSYCRRLLQSKYFKDNAVGWFILRVKRLISKIAKEPAEKIRAY